MEINTHYLNHVQVAEVISEDVLVKTAHDGLELLANLYYQGFEWIILHEKNVTPDFFDLKNGLAGEVLQKFSNYRVRLAIVGKFQYPGKSVRDFIFESNKIGHINFVSTVDEAITKLTK